MKHATSMIEREDFLTAMSKTAQTVYILSTSSGDGSSVMTVSSVTSVSADPPILSVCVHEGRPDTHACMEGGYFTLSMLDASDAGLSDAYAGHLDAPHEHLTMDDAWHQDEETRQWYYTDACYNFICKISQKVQVGSHIVYFGKVVRLIDSSGDNALIYQDRGYKS